MINQRSVKVLYVVGAGRSGSTLLTNILGQLDGFANIGELYYLWENGILNDGVCGCGKRVQDCLQWQEPLYDVFGDDVVAAAHTMNDFLQRAVRTRHIPVWLISSIANRRLKSERTTIEQIERFYSVLGSKNGGKVLVDASKFPSYALLLSRLPAIDLYVLHLVRDPRAVAYSWQRKKLDPATNELFGRMGQTKSSIVWTAWNSSSELLRYRMAKHDKYLRIQYEDFIAAPELTIAKISEFTSETVTSLSFSAKQEIALKPTHCIAGNPVRFQVGATRLKSDDEWVDHMRLRDKIVATALTWPLLLRYHYSQWVAPQ